MELTGKWRYREEYGYGMTEGELVLTQEGEQLSGRIIFTDRMDDEEEYMIQEFVRGWVRDRKVKLEAYEYDIIHSEHEVVYELDCWFGILLDEGTIKGISEDDQGVEGYFVFERMEE
ncbi:MAG: hypothetical protein NC410_08420 [Oscillibacter sp.]|nr:hypothetical protein [Oscillibacter sp.]